VRRPALPSNQLEALERLTILVPTRDRQDFLIRLVAVWGGTPVRLVLIDGSDHSVSATHREVIESAENVCYLHSPVSYVERLKLAASYVSTPYAVTSGDDEFLLPAGLAAAIRALDQDPGLAGCVGQSLRFFPTRRRQRLMFEMGYPYWRYQRDEDSAEQRILHAMDGYNAATCYAVLRSDAWTESWGSVDQWTCLNAPEIQQAVAVHARGRFVTVDELFWLRSEENPAVDLAERRRLRLIEWWRSAEHAEERRRYVARLAADLENAASIPSTRALEVVGSALDAVVATQDAMTHAGEEARRRVGRRVGRGIRSAGLSLLGRFIPDTGLVRIRDILARLGSAVGCSDQRFLGGPRAAARRCPAALLEANPDMASVLTDVETVVRTFHRARAIGGTR
jgi:glycosyltransferase domain-containing protein